MAATDLVLAMTGASGAPYGLRLLEVLLQAGRIVHLTLSPAATEVLEQETERRVRLDAFALTDLLGDAAKQAGFDHFRPDACLINRYQPGARMSLHQDKDEKDFEQPIVSVSLGLPAVFLFGGFTRSSAAVRLPLEHGDVVVWGGEDRLRYHGVVPLKPGTHPLVGSYRLNLTFRKAT